MSFEEVVDQAAQMLQRRGQLSYGLLKRQFDLDDAALGDLKEELLYSHPHIEDDGRGLVWSHATTTLAETDSSSPEPTPQTSVDQDQPIQKESSSPAVPVSDAERRQLTVMFCDLVDSTRLASQLDPEDLREVVRAYQEQAASVIQHYEGHIAQYLGDGLLVYFGWPSAHEDDAHRAVHTGLGIVEAVDDLNTTLETAHGIRLAVRIGIHTGSVVVGEMGGGGRHENLALGEAPNIAARLEGLAAPNSVVMSDETRRLVAGTFDCDDLGMPELKGVSEAMAVFRIRGVSEATSRFEANTTTLTPMVGREVEVDLLMQRWEQVLEGEGQVVLLNGPPGIGKSRLVQAFCSRLAESSHVRLRYQCSPYHTNSALYPIAIQLNRAMGLPADAASDAKLDRLEALVAQTRLPEVETVPLFAAMLSIPTDNRYPPLRLNPEGQKTRTFELFAQGLVNLSQQEPVLFLFEDIHWSDPTSLEALSLVIDQVQEARVFVVLTYRPEFDPPWRNDGHVTTHGLSRLSRRQSIGLVDRVTGGKALPTEVLDQIVAKTDGIPLYVEELTKHVLESEWLRSSGDTYELTTPLPSLAIPATLQDSLMARLDRLGEVKEVAQLGATIGREFSYALLQAVSPLSDSALQDALGQLLDADLISQRGSVPESTYSFKHALIQDAAYQSMLRSTRQQVHRQIAHVLDREFPAIVDTQPEVLAHHFTQGEVWEEAFAYLGKSGDKARQVYANQEAITFYSQALEASERITPALDEAQLLPLYEGRGLVWMLSAKPDAAMVDYEMMCQMARASGNRRREGASLCHLARAHQAKQSEDSLPFVEQYAQEALHLSQQIGDEHIRGLSLAILGHLETSRGNLPTADRRLKEALQISRQESDQDTLASTLLSLCQQAYYQGQFQSARGHGGEGVSIARDGHNSLLELRCLTWFSLPCWSAGHYAEALTILHEGMAKAKERETPFFVARLTNHLGWFHRELGDVFHAVDYDQEGVELGRAAGIANAEISALINLGLDYLVLGQYDHAQSCLTPTLERVAREGFGSHRWRWTIRLTIGLAELFYMMGDYEQSLNYVDEGLKEAQRTSSQKYVVQGWALHGKIASKLGDMEAAGTDLQRAFSLAEQLQSPSLIYPIAHALGQWHESSGHEREAVTLYGKAKSTIKQMATAVEDEVLRSTFLQSALVQEIHEHAARVGG